MNLELLEKAEFVHNFLWTAADLAFKENNPCKISKNGVCRNNKNNTCCAKDCRFLTPGGCSTNCLTCKLYLCVNIARRYKKLNTSISKIRFISYSCGFQTLFYQSGKEELYESMKRGLKFDAIERCAKIIQNSQDIDVVCEELTKNQNKK
jgi:hypothetical protein